MTVHEIPAATADRLQAVRQRLAELDALARAEQAMADGCPTADQELLLMSVGSLAHRARRQLPAAPRRDGPSRWWPRRARGER